MELRVFIPRRVIVVVAMLAALLAACVSMVGVSLLRRWRRTSPNASPVRDRTRIAPIR